MADIPVASKSIGNIWAGPLPASWDVALLGCVARVFAGGTPDRAVERYWESGTIPWLSSGEVNQLLVETPTTYITQDAVANSSARWIPPGALLIALAGQGKTKGMVAQLAFDATCNQSLAAIIPSGRVDARYLLWWLTAHYETLRNLAGGELRDGLNLEIIRSIPCPVPPIETQRAIATLIDSQIARIDRVISAKERLSDLLRERLAGLISETVFGDAQLLRHHSRTPIADPTKVFAALDEVLSSLPLGWKVERLSRATTLIEEEDTDASRPLLSLSSDGHLRHRSEDAKQAPSIDYRLRYHRIKAGDLVVNPMWLVGGGLGVADMDGAVSPEYRVYRPTSRVNPRFLHWLVRSEPYRAQYRLLIRAETTFDRRVSKDDFRDLPLVIPPLPVQQDIARALDLQNSRVGRLLSSIESTIVRLRDLRLAFITDAVLGSQQLAAVS